jgi:hypothetical protein
MIRQAPDILSSLQHFSSVLNARETGGLALELLDKRSPKGNTDKEFESDARVVIRFWIGPGQEGVL